MTAKFFVDTNVLVYAASKAAADQDKRRLARAILSQLDIGFSAQVMQEFYSVAVSRTRLQLTHDEAVAVLRSFSAFPVYPITRELVLEAAVMRQSTRISYWDAAILAAAKRMGCATVYSEDLNAGQDYDGVKVVNPFGGLGAP